MSFWNISLGDNEYLATAENKRHAIELADMFADGTRRALGFPYAAEVSSAAHLSGEMRSYNIGGKLLLCIVLKNCGEDIGSRHG